MDGCQASRTLHQLSATVDNCGITARTKLLVIDGHYSGCPTEGGRERASVAGHYKQGDRDDYCHIDCHKQCYG